MVQEIGKWQWVTASGGEVPNNALSIGSEADGRTLYSGRCTYRGGLQVGKVAPHLCGLHISWGGQEITVSDYEVLVGNSAMCDWKDIVGPALSPEYEPFSAGYEDDGRELFIGRKKDEENGGTVVGKCGAHIKLGMNYAYGGSEMKAERYQVLVCRNH